MTPVLGPDFASLGWVKEVVARERPLDGRELLLFLEWGEWKALFGMAVLESLIAPEDETASIEGDMMQKASELYFEHGVEWSRIAPGDDGTVWVKEGAEPNEDGLLAVLVLHKLESGEGCEFESHFAYAADWLRDAGLEEEAERMRKALQATQEVSLQASDAAFTADEAMERWHEALERVDA